MPAKGKSLKTKEAGKKVSKKEKHVISTEQLRSPEVQHATGFVVPDSKGSRRKSPFSNKMAINPDISRIVKVPGDHEPDDMEEPFDPPLHSTAVYEADELEREELSKENSPKQLPHVSPISKEAEKGNTSISVATKRKAIDSSKGSSIKRNTIVEKTQTPNKLGSPAAESKSFSDTNDSPEKMNSEHVPDKGSTAQPSSEALSSTSQDTDNVNKSRKESSRSNMASHSNNKSQGGKSSSSRRRKSRASGVNKTIPLNIWCTEDLPRKSRDFNELDIVLGEFEKIIANYKRTIDSPSCNKAVDKFCASLREGIITSIENAQKLKNLKGKNAKMQLEIGKKRKRLIEVRNELIENEPKLKNLLKECSELQEKQSSLKIANEFLTNLKELKGNYLKYKKENPSSKESYGIPSLPALLLQSQTVLKAEKHFHNISTILQNIIDQKKKNR